MTILEQLRRDEGVRRLVYYVNDPQYHPVPHVGVGHNLRDNPISDAAIDQILHDDVAACEAGLDRVIPWWRTLSEARQGVLLNMAFNIGVPGFVEKNPKFLAFVKAGEYEPASQEMLDGPWSQEVPARAYRLSLQMKNDLWQ